MAMQNNRLIDKERLETLVTIAYYGNKVGDGNNLRACAMN